MIDLVFLREAKRIRKEYLDSLAFIVKHEDEIYTYIDEIKEIQTQIESLEVINDETLNSRMLFIEKNIINIHKILDIHKNKIEKLDKDSEKLYEKIIEKFPNRDFNEIKNEIIKFIEPVDFEFAKDNVDVYKKIKKRNNE